MWSISIYTGNSPFTIEPFQSDPVLTKDHVTGVPAAFVADPFMVHHDQTYYMFMEVMNAESRRGEIGLATSPDALSWTYKQIVLSEPYHLSYPYVFECENEYYMLPEAIDAGAITLYKADEFPTRWSRHASLIRGRFADPSIVHHADRWWLFACPTPYQHNTLHLYSASQLLGPWFEHPRSPLVRNDQRRARPAGRILKFDHKLFRFAQDCVPRYGSCVRTFEILELTPSSYAEVEIGHGPVLKATGHGWNANGMHHIDAHQLPDGNWLACVDGSR
jgi:sucrose-6-phosphate hydrolase SacC (GH32 family)